MNTRYLPNAGRFWLWQVGMSNSPATLTGGHTLGSTVQVFHKNRPVLGRFSQAQVMTGVIKLSIILHFLVIHFLFFETLRMLINYIKKKGKKHLGFYIKNFKNLADSVWYTTFLDLGTASYRGLQLTLPLLYLYSTLTLGLHLNSLQQLPVLVP